VHKDRSGRTAKHNVFHLQRAGDRQKAVSFAPCRDPVSVSFPVTVGPRESHLSSQSGTRSAPLPEAVPEPGEPQKAQRAQKGDGVVAAEVGSEGDACFATPTATASPTKGCRTAESSVARSTAAPKVPIPTVTPRHRSPSRYKSAAVATRHRRVQRVREAPPRPRPTPSAHPFTTAAPKADTKRASVTRPEPGPGSPHRCARARVPAAAGTLALAAASRTLVLARAASRRAGR